LKIASKIVDMVFYSSTPENNQIVKEIKKEFRDGIVVRREELENYIDEVDCVLIGPGMLRNSKVKSQKSKFQFKSQKLEEINKIEDEGEQTYYLTNYLLAKYPQKRWVIDAGALQMLDLNVLPLEQTPIFTPHRGEFEMVFGEKLLEDNAENIEKVCAYAKNYRSLILLKGVVDIVCLEDKFNVVKGGNSGMTKGGMGDVLSGLIASLYCKNDAFLSAISGSYIAKTAGDELFKRSGYYFNASDLIDEIPRVMKEIIL